MGNGIGLASPAAAGGGGGSPVSSPFGGGLNPQYAAALVNAGMSPAQVAQMFASPIGLDRLVRKEVALGAVREILPPQEHMGLRIAPFKEVATDDVIFDYIKAGLQEGLAPARAEDSEAELAQKDDLLYGQGRAAVIDWSLKDRYSASDVSRYREALWVQQSINGIDANQLPLNFVGNTVEDFQARLARHDALRRRKLDNRLEWMVMQSIETGGIAYNDGKIKFTVSYGRPAGQQNQAPASGLWSTTTFDPIGDIIAMNDTMYNTYGTRLQTAITSTRVLNSIWKSNRFISMSGLTVGGTPSAPIDLNYVMPGWNQQAAIDIVERATGVRFVPYDSVYFTRAVGSTTRTMNRFLSDNKIYFLPTTTELNGGGANQGVTNTVTFNPAVIGIDDDTDIGFAKMLTAPHPEGQWTSGYYEWEDEKRDPWMHVRGTGIKAFPIFPYMELTYTMTVL
jgi:hypothetical protein